MTSPFNNNKLFIFKNIKKVLLPMLLLPAVAFAQPGSDEYVIPLPRNTDYIYTDNIRTVRCHADGIETSYPIIELNSGGQILVSFDDLDADYKDYYYTVEHCNADWTRSQDISEFDYLDGFREDRIVTMGNSVNTLINYTHYELLIPNAEIRITKSGNYLLKIYLNADVKDLVITRRFMIIEPIMSITAQVDNAADVAKLPTHQEVDFVVNHKDISITNPRLEIKVAVMQNGQWDKMITGISPMFQKPEELVYDFQDKITFPAGKEFRPLDMRSFQFRSQQIKLIQRTGFDWKVFLFDDLPRQSQAYFFLRDLNGRYFIENSDERGNDYFADYAEVEFNLKADEYPGGDVYVTGAFTDWQPRAQFRMKYDITKEKYTLKTKVKQGYYDYAYCFVPFNSEKTSLSAIEGDDYETNNEYLVLVYYRPFGERYDRLTGMKIIYSY